MIASRQCVLLLIIIFIEGLHVRPKVRMYINCYLLYLFNELLAIQTVKFLGISIFIRIELVKDGGKEIILVFSTYKDLMDKLKLIAA